MYVVAVTRWARPLEQEVGALSPLLGMAPYDLKLRLGGPLPVLFAREPDAARARQLLATLRGRGHGAVACDVARVADSAEMTCPRTYAFEPAAFAGESPEWGRREMPYAEVAGLIHASAATFEQTSSVTKQRKFSLGRAALTGGIAMRKTTTTEKRSQAEEREQVLYVIRNDARDPWLLRESRLRHLGLGDRIRPTSAENFATLVELLRERAPQALYDDALRRRPRKADGVSVSGTTAHKVTEVSNASETDLAVHLIVVAHLTGQR